MAAKRHRDSQTERTPTTEKEPPSEGSGSRLRRIWQAPAMVAAISGLIASLIGAVVGGLIAWKAQPEQAQIERRAKAALKMFEPNVGNYPKEVAELLSFFNVLAFATVADAKTIQELARLQKSNPGCFNRMDEMCRDVMAKYLVIVRAETGAGSVAVEEMRQALELNFIRAEQIMRQSLNR